MTDSPKFNIRIVTFGARAADMGNMLASAIRSDISSIRVTSVIHPAALARMSKAERTSIGMFNNMEVSRVLMNICIVHNAYFNLSSSETRTMNKTVIEAIRNHVMTLNSELSTIESMINNTLLTSMPMEPRAILKAMTKTLGSVTTTPVCILGMLGGGEQQSKSHTGMVAHAPPVAVDPSTSSAPPKFIPLGRQGSLVFKDTGEPSGKWPNRLRWHLHRHCLLQVHLLPFSRR
jgi:hypothetical protein